jgi:hypothetical protein
MKVCQRRPASLDLTVPRRTAASLCAALAMALTPAAGALEWRQVPELTVQSSRDDNVYLQPTNALAVTMSAVTAAVSVVGR